ncbi:hypothetical protein BCR32DRAFT_229818 [Anaeromyces robustus]|uniref:DNA-directed RNA polymerase III subunit RPC8 n=1 Tax=Anaeromyces robustus TaxID=1754192 RepID=A0A1Y1XHJ4_9FUNG|nr:hypothetical protein BCR32DRAFT_229818 [Anaeromyces robustus]|eukprot:ORX85228.1 hypothetical protein BCR32DRAFT_229818 [Anaeromyces robustus]
MFMVTTIKDTVKILPRYFYKNRNEAIIDEINHKYSNKVLHNVGLCIELLDLIEVSDGIVLPCKDGSYTVKVTFKMIVFRPFIGETLIGKVSNSSEKGIKVSMGFFDDITIPASQLTPDTTFDKTQNVWIWNFNETDKLYIDKNEEIRFQVLTELFVDTGPMSKKKPFGQDPQESTKQLNESAESELVVPYSIIGTITQQGLGLTSWWE